MLTPSLDYQRTAHRVPQKPLAGLDARVHALIGVYRRRSGILQELSQQAEQADALASSWQAWSDHDLREHLREFRERFRRGRREVNNDLLPALAALREAAHRTIGLRAFQVQLAGALALHRGYLAEMATGEGKTLTAGLAGVLAGWTRQPTHIITVNDYLVRRDAEWLAPFYQFCRVRVGIVTGQMPPPERQKGYAADVTYATSKEVLADFLRDRLRLGAATNATRLLIRRMLDPRATPLEGVVMRGLHTALIDEADSVLIDEAVTPLIIAQPHRNDSLRQATATAAAMVAPLQPELDYRSNARYKEVELTSAGLRKIAESTAPLPGIWRSTDRRTELLKQALVAREFFHRGKQYIIHDGKIVIVDEFTGRQMPQRSWRQGMHQAIEAKESLEMSDPTETVARLSFQRFFRCYHRLAGMTGTAKEAAGEFWQIYKLPVLTIPTHRPCIRQQWPDRVFATEDEKWGAVVSEIVRLHDAGRPLLVGTRSVNANEHLAKLLRERRLEFHLLNAVNSQAEAHIIKSAGDAGRITLATNMAGRGTDILLGGGVAEGGGLHVIATERHESGRVDRQLFGRSGRQGDPGSAQAFVSAQDELIRRYLPAPAQMVLERAIREGIPGQKKLTRAAFALAQREAQAIAFQQRKQVLRTDTWLDDALSFAGSPGA